MFCTVKQNKNKYAVYLSERVREDGKVKSNDKYLFSLKAEEIENKAYYDKVQYTSLSDEEKQLVINKLDSMNISLHITTDNIPIQDTTRIDLRVEIPEVLTYDVYVKGVLIRTYDSLDMEHTRMGIIAITFRDACIENGIDTDCNEVSKAFEWLLNLRKYHQEKKKEIEQAKIEAAAYYENTIMALRIKIAELENSSGSIKHTTTTDQTKVKKIYRALANKLHPDNGGSDELMQMLNELKGMVN